MMERIKKISNSLFSIIQKILLEVGLFGFYFLISGFFSLFCRRVEKNAFKRDGKNEDTFWLKPDLPALDSLNIYQQS